MLWKPRAQAKFVWGRLRKVFWNWIAELSSGLLTSSSFISFYRRCFWPQSQKSLAWNHTHAIMSFHWAHFQRGFIGLEPSHQVRAGFVNHVPHCPAFQTTCTWGNRTSGSCSLWQQPHVFISFFQKSLFGVWKSELAFYRKWKWDSMKRWNAESAILAQLQHVSQFMK